MIDLLNKVMYMARYKNNSNQGMGGIIVVVGIIFFVLFLMLIPTLPFQVSNTEQALMYLMSFVIIMAGLVLTIK